MGFFDNVLSDPFRAGAALITGGASEYSGGGTAYDVAGKGLKKAEDVWNTISGKSAEEAAAEAARLQGTATGQSVAEARRQFDIGQANLAPWLQAGRRGLTDYMALMGLGGDTAGALSALRASPGYTFRLSQGQRGLEAGSAARGGMGSGKALTAATQFGQDYASNEYQNRLNSLAGLSSQGQASATGQAAMGANLATNLGNLWTSGANAQGAATMAGQQARQSGLLGLLGLGASLYGRR